MLDQVFGEENLRGFYIRVAVIISNRRELLIACRLYLDLSLS